MEGRARAIPRAFDNPQRAQELSQEYARLKDLAALGQAYLKAGADLAQNRALFQSEPAGFRAGANGPGGNGEIGS